MFFNTFPVFSFKEQRTKSLGVINHIVTFLWENNATFEIRFIPPPTSQITG